jgi:hypothetical protein
MRGLEWFRQRRFRTRRSQVIATRMSRSQRSLHPRSRTLRTRYFRNRPAAYMRTCIPPIPRTRSMKAKVHVDDHLHRDGMSLVGRWSESVSPHRLDGLLVKPHPEMAYHANILRIAL